MVKTGYFGRAQEHGHKGCVSQVHLVYTHNEKPLCKYRPHKTMSYQLCAAGVHLPYVRCAGCILAYEKLQKALIDRQKAIAGITKKHRLPQGVL